MALEGSAAGVGATSTAGVAAVVGMTAVIGVEAPSFVDDLAVEAKLDGEDAAGVMGIGVTAAGLGVAWATGVACVPLTLLLALLLALLALCFGDFIAEANAWAKVGAAGVGVWRIDGVALLLLSFFLDEDGAVGVIAEVDSRDWRERGVVVVGVGVVVGSGVVDFFSTVPTGVVGVCCFGVGVGARFSATGCVVAATGRCSGVFD